MIEVISIPPLATIQDLGRHGYWFQGLGQAGVMDVLSHRIANLLLGNDESVATLEIPLTPVRLCFHTEQAFSIAGAACRAQLGDQALPNIWAGIAKAGQVLKLGVISQGARIYLALPGGIDVPVVLGSRSTQLRECFGGLDGRMLVAGDTLGSLKSTWDKLPAGGLSVGALPLKKSGCAEIELRTLPSAELHSFSKRAQHAFWSTPYRVSPTSNRQGYRLEGEELARKSSAELRSHGIVPGIVQVPGNGQPIIQLSDTATMGGYPAIGAVIESDLWRLGQARAGEYLRFVRVDLDQAASAQSELKDWVMSLSSALAETHELLGSSN
jgi:biotin-dependent carboxylase-like uncharacterized protein